MEIEEQNQLEPNHIEWLAKGTWFDWEAACIIMNANPEIHVRRNEVYGNHYIYRHPEAERLLAIIRTFTKPWHGAVAPPFWYINEILKKQTAEIPKSLLTAMNTIVSKYIPADKEKVIKSYDYLADALNITSTIPKETSPEVDALKRIIDLTYEMFWRNVDPAKPPKSEAIIEWIVEKFKIANRNAIAIDTMIRPDLFSKGGNKSKN